jgi:hypothetical protein
MMINTRSAAAFSITRLRAIQKVASKKVWPSPPFRMKISGHALHAF